MERRIIPLVLLLSILKCVKTQDEYDGTEKWNGCVGTISLKNSLLCYDLTELMDGLTAWKHCMSLDLTDEFRNSPTALSLANQLKLPPGNGTSGDSVWIGGIEKYQGSASYVGYHGSLPGPGRIDSTSGRGCLALDPSKGFEIVRKNCDQKLQRICVYKKFETTVYNGSASDACGDGQVAALQGCYKITDNCTRDLFLMCPKSVIGTDKEDICSYPAPYPLDYINRFIFSESPMVVELNVMHAASRTWKREGSDTDESDNGIELCFAGNGTKNIIRFELRHNKTAGGLTLWTKGRGRMAEWPPKCIGGRVEKSPPDKEDPNALHVSRFDGAEEVWCYALDIITGTIALSNSVSFKTYNSCTEAQTTGIPAGTIVDERASCLQCLRSTLIMCNETSHTGCYEDVFFGISSEKWETVLKRDGGLEEVKRCAEDEACAVAAYWELTEGEDCNGDGYVDCDDRFARIFDQGCNEDPRNFEVLGSKYWLCRTNPRRDFVDFQSGNMTVRFYCEDNLHLGRIWLPPEKMSGISPYAVHSIAHSIPEVSSTETPVDYLVPTNAFEPVDPSQLKHAKGTLERLQHFTSNIVENTMEVKNIIKNFSSLLDFSDSIVRKAMGITKVFSLPQLLENILINVPMDVNESTDNLAVFKQASVGFQLLSDKPSVKHGTLGKNRRQIPMLSETDMKGKEKLIEVAVLIPGLRKDVSLTVVTYAKNSEFIPCRPPVTSQARESPGTRSDQSGSSPVDDAHEVVSTPPQELSEEYCPLTPGIVRGCINSFVVQVGLLSKDRSYVPLESGNHVDIKFRTDISPSLYQRRQCVYWHVEKRGWAYDGCDLHEEEDGLVTCRCSHLTHFAQLITDADALLGPDEEYLHIITICCSVVSLVSFVSMLVIGATVTNWRKKKENKIMINLAASFSIYLGFFLYCAVFSKSPLDVDSCDEQKPSLFCQIKGGALHYLVLSSFWWMLMAATTHYLRLTTIKGIDIDHYVFKSMLVGWGIPVLPVAILIVLQPDAYAGSRREFCYPTGNAFYGAVLVPVLVVFIGNGVMFVLILRELFPKFFACRKVIPPLPSFYKTKKILYRKLALCFILTFLFGLTWYFGLMSCSIVPAYFVSLSVGLQGPLLFLMFVIGEENIRRKICFACDKIKTNSRYFSSARTSSINENIL